MVSMGEGSGLGDLDHFAAFVLAAGGADAVRHLLFAAIGALGEAGGLEVVMGAARRGAALGVASFRIRHFSLLP
jgi:hypothetical protein